MVSAASFVGMAITLIICFALPLGGLLVVNRGRRPGVGRAFACGMLSFFLSQVVTRLPLMTMVVPHLPQPYSSFFLSVPVASFSAGLFEETGRLLVMLWLMKRFHRFVDGVAFGLGHGGLEAMLLIGLSFFNNIVVAVLINTGGWDAVGAALPPEQSQRVREIMITTPPQDFLLAGVERIGALGLHTMNSLIILAGIVNGRKALAWLAAFLLHGLSNLGMISAVQAKVPGVVVELVSLVVIGVLLALVVRRLRPTYPTAAGTPMGPAYAAAAPSDVAPPASDI